MLGYLSGAAAEPAVAAPVDMPLWQVSAAGRTADAAARGVPATGATPKAERSLVSRFAL